MSNAAKAHEPTMEEILASIRRIIADDEPGAEAKAEAKPAAAAKPAPAPAPAPPPPPAAAAEPAVGMGQDDIDAMLASFDSPAPKAAAPAPPPPPADDDVLELTKPVAKAASQPEVDFVESEPAAEAVDDAGWGEIEADPEPMPAPPPRAAPAPSAAVSRAVGDALLDPATGTAVASAFSSLAHTILGQNARTLDDLVEEMLRPMLKAWLDDNLPGIVERLVRSEIERVSRGPKR